MRVTPSEDEEGVHTVNVAAAGRYERDARRVKRTLAQLAVAFCCVGIFASAAWAAYDYVYFQGYGPDGQMGGDLDVLYRNYNDACIGDGPGWAKSIYGLSDGSWVAAVDAYTNCTTKAHLGPSSNYGYTYVQAKCKNISGVYTYMLCNTSRP